jgi:hypothetical protein
LPARSYTASEVDAAVARLTDPDRFAHASAIVTHAAPEELLLRASGEGDPVERLEAVRTLVDEQTRVGMLVGVAVGFELANELADPENTSSQES